MDKRHAVASVNEIRSSRPPVRDVNGEHQGSFTALERVAIWITDHVGTMGFFLVLFAWTVLWLGWNTLGPAPVDSTRTLPSCCGSSSATCFRSS